MDGERIERGEVRIVTVPGRSQPAVIISSNEYNDRFGHAVVALMSLAGHGGGYQVWVDTGESKGFANVDKVSYVRLPYVGSHLGRVPRKTMGRIDDLLESLFDLGYEDEDADRLKRELKECKDTILSQAAAVSKYKTLYESALKQIAEMQVTADVAKIVTEKKEADDVIEETAEESPEKKPSKKEAKKVNVNTATIRELVQVGFDKTAAAHIVLWGQSCGGFESLDDLLAVDGVTGKKLRKLRDKLEI